MTKKLDYKELLVNPPIFDARKLKGKRELIFTMVSCMCNNISYIRLKKNAEGEFKLFAFINSINIINYFIKIT